MGYWLILFIFLIIGAIFIDNWFNTSREKLPFYSILALLFCSGIGWGYYDWREHTLTNYELTQSYLVVEYIAGNKEYINYSDIQETKYFFVGKTSSRCGLSFYFKNREKLETLPYINCKDIRTLQSQINQKISSQ